MIWLILIAVVILGYISYRFSRRFLMETRANRARQSGVFEKRDWSIIPFDTAGIPMQMAFSEVATKNAYQMNFQTMFNLFVYFALKVDTRLDTDEVQKLINQLYSDLSEIKFLNSSHKMTNEYCMLQSATLYALIYTQNKGVNIKNRLMKGQNNQAGNDMFLQKKSDREYFEYMNKEHTNFCQLVNIMDARKSSLIEIVAGYLLTD